MRFSFEILCEFKIYCYKRITWSYKLIYFRKNINKMYSPFLAKTSEYPFGIEVDYAEGGSFLKTSIPAPKIKFSLSALSRSSS